MLLEVINVAFCCHVCFSSVVDISVSIASLISHLHCKILKADFNFPHEGDFSPCRSRFVDKPNTWLGVLPINKCLYRNLISRSKIIESIIVIELKLTVHDFIIE